MKMIRNAGNWISGAACIVRIRVATPQRTSAAPFTGVISRIRPMASATVGSIEAPVASASVVTIVHTIVAQASAAGR